MPEHPSPVLGAAAFQNRLNEAIATFNRGDFPACEAICRELLAHQPDNPDAMSTLGSVLLNQQRPQEALPLLERSMALGADAAEDHYALGAVHYNLGHPTEAARALRACLEREPGNAYALSLLGDTCLNLGADAEAWAAGERLAQLAPLTTPLGLNGRVVQIVAAYNQERFTVVIRLADEVLASYPDQEDASRLRLYARHRLAGAAETEDDQRTALANYREALRQAPAFSAARTNYFNALHATGAAAKREDFAPQLTASDKQHLVIACFPKSGSSFLFQVLAALTGYEQTDYFLGALGNEMELYPPHIIDSWHRDTLTQQHFRANEPNLRVLEAFALKPVVLVRNLFDTIVSMTDFYRKGHAPVGTHFRGFAQWDRERQLDATILRMGHWYIEFYATWWRECQQGRRPLHWLTYETMCADKVAAVEAIVTFYGLPFDRATVARVVAAVDGEHDRTRFNRGVAGRGAQQLSAAQQERLRAMTTFYPDVDFRDLGL